MGKSIGVENIFTKRSYPPRYIYKKQEFGCRLCADGIMGSYFFKNQVRQKTAVNGDYYRTTITDFLLFEIEIPDL